MNPAARSADPPPQPDGAPWQAGERSAAPERSPWWRWMDDAACRGVGPAEFFGRSEPGALRRCRDCPVAEICFWWAIVAESDLGYRFGIWGGAGPAVRERVARVTGIEYARSRFLSAASQWSERRARPMGEQAA
jgi:transcription factor WhiB